MNNPKTETVNWFFLMLERLAASHGARALAQTQLSLRGLTFERHTSAISGR
jgi:hypothetical protein